MAEELVRWRTEGPVTRLALDRPSALNALSPALADAFREAVARIAKEPSRVVVVTGAGAFSAGGDLGFIEANTRLKRKALEPLMRRFYASFLSVRELPQATIAQVGGAAVGAGLCLALACDLRSVLASARLSLNFARLGLSPGMAAWPLARAALGDARARDLLFTGRFFTGRDLHAWGGASLVAETPLGLEAKTRALAAGIAGGSPLAMRLLKAETRLSDPLEPFLRLEAKCQAESFVGPDIREGVAAVRAGRAPKF